MWYIDQWNGIKSPEINPHIYGQLILNNDAKIIQKGKRIRFLTNDADFPGGPVVTNLPSNEGDAGSIPGQGTKIPHAAGQLSPELQRPRALEPMRHN